MNPFRFFRAAGFAAIAVLPSFALAQGEVARAVAAAHDQARKELEEIYAYGTQKLAPPWRGLLVQDDAAIFVRPESATPPAKGQGSVWTDRELPVPGYVDKEKPYVSVRERFVADCGGRKLGLAEWVYYSERYGSGAVVARDRNAQPEMTQPLPDSLEEQIHTAACPKPVPKPPKPKPVKKVAKAKPDEEKDKADGAKEGPKEKPKAESKKEAAKNAAKQKAAARKAEPKIPVVKPTPVKPEPLRTRPKEVAKSVEAANRASAQRMTAPRKKPAPEPDAGETTSTAGRR